MAKNVDDGRALCAETTNRNARAALLLTAERDGKTLGPDDHVELAGIKKSFDPKLQAALITEFDARAARTGYTYVFVPSNRAADEIVSKSGMSRRLFHTFLPGHSFTYENKDLTVVELRDAAGIPLCCRSASVDTYFENWKNKSRALRDLNGRIPVPTRKPKTRPDNCNLQEVYLEVAKQCGLRTTLKD
eukprot:CAMPEP_0198652862 /NCGR_PEP_ID=MMETSP1467-20131203/6679_1 /TAXON_ID=1462469 /ORGANISM="unid. sp., Strain CCMP2135" /LENGTH=188 /DNA_ID=CAMNT_0044388805 /DNA_START=14 /DNA_END=580 /DNA_ORIENTATION=-